MLINNVKPWDIAENDIYKINLTKNNVNEIETAFEAIPENTPAVKVFVDNKCVETFMPIWTMNGTWNKGSQKVYNNLYENGYETSKEELATDVIMNVMFA